MSFRCGDNVVASFCYDTTNTKTIEGKEVVTCTSLAYKTAPGESIESDLVFRNLVGSLILNKFEPVTETTEVKEEEPVTVEQAPVKTVEQAPVMSSVEEVKFKVRNTFSAKTSQIKSNASKAMSSASSMLDFVPPLPHFIQ